MRWSLIILFILCFSTAFGQILTSRFEINMNDVAYRRIFNGRIIANNVVIKNADRIKIIRVFDDIKSLGIATSRPVMILETDRENLEPAFEQQLSIIKENNLEALRGRQLPIAINGKLLIEPDKRNVLSKIKTDRIKSMVYLKPDKAKVKYKNVPFGVVELTYR